jgi:Zn-dependent membrane protease YugP
MAYFVVIFLIIVVVYCPQFWSKYILKKYNRDEYFSGSGMDLAEILLDRMNLSQVRMEATDLGDHYDPLNVEWDASFKRALPILETGEYIPEDNLPAARRILIACALTYVASALASLLNLWRWIRLLRR